MNELNEKKEVLELSDPNTGWLAKSKQLLLSNLNQKFTPTQNVLFSLALLHAEVNGTFAKAEFGIDEVIKLTNNAKYERFEKKAITRDRVLVAASSINLGVDIESDLPKDFIGGTFQIFSNINYIRGKYHVYFNTNLDENGFSPIVWLLKSTENNPLMYNINVFSKLKSAGQSLYENILVASNNNTKNMFLTLEDIKLIFKANGKTMNNFKSLNYRHLAPAIEDINKHTELNVEVIKIKTGKAVTGVELKWSLEKVSLPPSNKQKALMNDLYVQLKQLAPIDKKDLQLLEKLKTNHLLSSSDAQRVIAATLKRVNELKHIEEYPELPVPTKTEKDFADFFSKFGKLTDKNIKEVLSRISIFPEEEQEKLLNFAYDIYYDNGGQSIRYIITLLVEWDLEEVKTLEDAKRIHIDNYGTNCEIPKNVKVSDDFLNAMNLWKD